LKLELENLIPNFAFNFNLRRYKKALQDYLETKRISFPRFYFVAPADLLDILSKAGPYTRPRFSSM
jgi:hypothetical protein